jgi:hypothetical protein
MLCQAMFVLLFCSLLGYFAINKTCPIQFVIFFFVKGDLLDFIDKKNMECLNQREGHPVSG